MVRVLLTSRVGQIVQAAAPAAIVVQADDQGADTFTAGQARQYTFAASAFAANTLVQASSSHGGAGY